MINVTVVLLHGNFASTTIGPLEVFYAAGLLWNTLQGQPPDARFRLRMASVRGEPVESAYHLGLVPETSIEAIEATDLIVVPALGLDFDGSFARHRDLFPWLRHHAAKGAYVAAVCTGAAYLAEAGLLDGREATTHWATADALRARFPKVKWCPDKLITEDRRVLCSGGVYASIDLSLYLVRKFCGHEIALQTAKSMVLDMPRACQSAYAVLPLSRPHDDEAIRRAEAFIENHFRKPLIVEELAREHHMSERNFIRRFKAATGRTPGNYLQATRISVAKHMLESGARSMQAVGEAVGYEDGAFFRALFRRETGLTPAQYRERFGGQHPALPRQVAEQRS